MSLALKCYCENAFRESFHHSDYEYWVLPSGSILSLTEGMVHGLIVEQYVYQTSDESVFVEALQHARAKDPDIKKTTFGDLWACEHLGWVRINISQYSDQFNVSWQRKLTPQALESLRIILDEHDMLDEEIWTDYGTVIGWKGLEVKLNNSTYWRLQYA